MLFNAQQLCLLILFIFSVGIVGTANKQKKWLNHLMRYAKSEVSQVLLLYDQEQTETDYEISSILRRMPRNFPRWENSFQEATDKKLKELSMIPSFIDLPVTTLVIMIYFSRKNDHLSRLKGPTEFVRNLSQSRRRPKCLIILAQENKDFTYEKLLQNMWSMRFLDVSVLQLIKEQNTKKSHFLGTQKAVIKIHSFNPFAGTYTVEEYTPNTKWFPEKTRNLHGITMKIGLYSSQPAVTIVRNNKGHVENVFGKDVSMTKTLSKAMNFEVNWKFSKYPLWGLTSCVKKENLGLVRDLIYNEIQYLGVQDAQYSTCDQNFYEWSGCFDLIHFRLVVRNIFDGPVRLSVEWKVYNALIVISLFALIWIVTRIMAFEVRNWKLHYFVQIALGLAAPPEPRKLAERIIFGCVLVICLLYSSFIYSAFTNTIIQKQEVMFDTIQEVVSSDLKPIISDSAFFYMTNYTDETTRSLLQKTVRLNISYEECLERMLYDTKLACIVREDAARLAVENYRDHCDKPIMKIVSGNLETGVSCWAMEEASPYVPRFDYLTLRMSESGLIEKWSRIQVKVKSVAPDVCSSSFVSVESLHLRRQVISLFACGYLASLLAFLGELLIALVMKKFNPRPVIALKKWKTLRRQE